VTADISEFDDGWDTLTYDDFNGGFGSYTDGGSDCYLYTGGTYAHQGSNAVDIQDNSGDSSSFFHTSGIDVETQEYISIKVDFWYYAVSMESDENWLLEYYDGSSWITRRDYRCGTEFETDTIHYFENNQFYHEVVYINETSYTFPSNMKMKFRCDASGNQDDIYIDNIYVNATTGEGISGTYCYNTTYAQPGNYNYFIWANDINGNSNMSSNWQFSVITP